METRRHRFYQIVIQCGSLSVSMYQTGLFFGRENEILSFFPVEKIQLSVYMSEWVSEWHNHIYLVCCKGMSSSTFPMRRLIQWGAKWWLGRSITMMMMVIEETFSLFYLQFSSVILQYRKYFLSFVLQWNGQLGYKREKGESLFTPHIWQLSSLLFLIVGE